MGDYYGYTEYHDQSGFRVRFFFGSNLVFTFHDKQWMIVHHALTERHVVKSLIRRLILTSKYRFIRFKTILDLPDSRLQSNIRCYSGHNTEGIILHITDPEFFGKLKEIIDGYFV